MLVESVLFAAALAVGLLVLLGRRRAEGADGAGGAGDGAGAGAGGRVVAAGVLVACLALPLLVVLERDVVYPVDATRPEDAEDRPVEDPGPGYVTSDTCRACHPRHHATWDHSYHRTMTMPATPESVIGAFDGQLVTFGDQDFRMLREGDEFWVEMDDPRWVRQRERARAEGREAAVPEEPPRVTHPVVMTTGRHRKQIYWYPTGMTRVLGQLELYWLPDEAMWIPRSAGFLSHPDRPTPPETGRWNTACIRCHATDGRPGIESPRNMDTRASELTIGCESCHGPAEAHVEHYRNPASRYAGRLGDGGGVHGGAGAQPADPIVNPADLSPRASSQVCGQCHGLNEFRSVADALRWEQHGFDYRPGDELDDTRITVQYDPDPPPGRMREAVELFPYYMENRFWSDGMIRLAGREYNGLIETACHTEGAMDCLSCHSMHQGPGDSRSLDAWRVDQLEPGMRGNEACLQCHADYRADVAAHTFHEPGSTGSNCYNCHMSYTGYGLLQAVRSHRMDSPSVATSLATGRPNACNQCHLDTTMGWAADHLQEWYGIPRPELTDEQESVAASVLWLLQGEAHVRALMAWSMGWEDARAASGRAPAGGPGAGAAGDGWMAPFLGQLLEDPYDAVRFIAHRSLKRHEGFEDFAYEFLGPTPFRAVARQRVWQRWREAQEAAGAQAVADPSLLLDEAGRLMEEALAELLKHRDDRPTHLQE